MEATEIKNDLHRLIDNFSDTKMLEQIYELLTDYQNRKQGVDILDELSKDQQIRLEASIKQSKNGGTISEIEVKKKVKDWLIR